MQELTNILEITNKIYEKLADEISRDLYGYRILYNLTKDVRYLNQMVMHWKPIQDLNDWLSKNPSKELMIYGAGFNGIHIADYIDGTSIKYFIDKNKSGTTINNIPVISPDSIDRETYKKFSIIISNKNGGRQIADELKQRGADSIYIIFEDTGGEYFEDFLPHTPDEIFVDAGVYDGGTTVDFVKWSPNYKHIYMFEPSENYYERFHKNVSGILNCDWIKKGLWIKDDILSFFDRPDHDVSIESNLNGIRQEYKYESVEHIELPVTSLDKYLDGKRVTFIKMDIEGSEVNALCGAEYTIKKWHPKLAICLYHKMEDPWEIPNIILQIDPTYRFYVRHHSFDMLDTILYAI